MTFSAAVAMLSRHLHTSLPDALDMDVDQFDHWFTTMLDVMKSEQPGNGRT